MLYGKDEFLKSTNMSEDELYAKISKKNLLGVDLKLTENLKILYKGQYFNRETEESFTGCFFLIPLSETDTVRLVFSDYNRQIDLVSCTINNELLYFLKDDFIAQLKFFMEFIKEDYWSDFTQFDILLNISGMSEKDFDAKLIKLKLLGVSLYDSYAVKHNKTHFRLVCSRLNSAVHILESEFNDLFVMIPDDTLLVVSCSDDLMTKYFNTLYDYYNLKRGLFYDYK